MDSVKRRVSTDSRALEVSGFPPTSRQLQFRVCFTYSSFVIQTTGPPAYQQRALGGALDARVGLGALASS